MNDKMKVGSVIICALVVLFCCICYTGFADQTISNMQTIYPEVKGCSARLIDAAPEGYAVRYFRKNDDLVNFEVLEVTWQLSNITNKEIGAETFWADYTDMDYRYLYTMEKMDKDLAISDYDNKRIIPPGEQAVYTDYVLVPKGIHEIRVDPGETATKSCAETEGFTLSF